MAWTLACSGLVDDAVPPAPVGPVELEPLGLWIDIPTDAFLMERSDGMLVRAGAYTLIVAPQTKPLKSVQHRIDEWEEDEREGRLDEVEILEIDGSRSERRDYAILWRSKKKSDEDFNVWTHESVGTRVYRCSAIENRLSSAKEARKACRTLRSGR